MLSMLLLLAVGPQTVIPAMPPAPPSRSANGTDMPALGDAGPGCASVVNRANDPSAGNGLMWREDGEPVGLYRLLDRRVNGCPDPIVVNYRVPGSSAVGREVGRAPAPPPSTSPVIVPRR